MTDSPSRPVRRRSFRWPSTTAVALAATLTLTSCASGGDTAATSSSSVGSPSSAASSDTSTAGSDSTSSSTEAGSLSTTEVTAGTGDVVALAEAFAATLTDEQKTALDQDYTFANATNWSNFPNALLTGMGGGRGGGMPTDGSSSGGMTGTPPDGGGMSGTPPTGTGGGTTSSGTGRIGLQTSTLSDAQWTALQALLAAATGSAAGEGYDEVIQHLLADDYLADNGGGDDYGQGNYFIAFLGTPSDTGTWELQFGGHHLAVANTYTDGALAGATPSFRGIEPLGTVDVDGVTVDPEEQERAAFAALFTSLDETQATTAKLSESFNDILLGPGNDWAFPTTAEGLPVSGLTDEQRALVVAAIKTYVDDVDDADAATILATYESELDQTTIAYSGTTGVTEVGDYVRIDGPSVWIEFSLQNGIVLDGAHPHAVWRDKKTDYAGLTA